MNAIRILIVDENPVFIRILYGFLHEEYPNQDAVVDTVTSFEIAPVKDKRLQPEVIIVDNGLPGLMGLFCVDRLRALCPEACIIVLTLQDKPDYRKSAFGAGANHFMQKDDVFSDLVPIIKRIANSKLFLQRFIPHVLLGTDFGGARQQRHQVDVLRLPQVFGLVGTGPVDDHHDEFLGMGATDLTEEFLHAHGVHLATKHLIEGTLERTDRAVDIHELPFKAIKHDRAPGQRRPHGAGRGGWRARCVAAGVPARLIRKRTDI